MRSRGCDIIYAQDPVSVGAPAACAAAMRRTPFMLKVVGDYAWEQATQRFGVSDLLDEFLRKTYGRRVEFFRRVETMVAQRAVRVIVPSEYLKTVVTHWGIAPERIRVIHNAFMPPASVVSKEEARHALGLEGTVIVSAGRLVPWKGFMSLIEMVAQMSGEIRDISLIIIGSGPDYDQLQEYAHRMGMRGRVVLTGGISHAGLVQYFAAADCVALYTAYEGFSHVVLEAMATGVPVVTTRVGGNAELITDGKDGFLITYGDKEGFKKAIRQACSMSTSDRVVFVHAVESKLSLFRADTVVQELTDVVSAI